MSKLDAFQVPLGAHLLSGLVSGMPGLWKWLGNLESTLLADQLAPVSIDRPVFLAGLARSGSTILLEAIAAHADVATHKYRDYPGIFTPYFWDGGQRRGQSSASSKPLPRAHADGLLVTPDSPEAMEEVLWMAFFSDAHNPAVSNVLDRSTEHPRFERFFSDHIRKLLLARDRRRYASKENYNVSRMQYLQKLFPDARFVIPIRQPQAHIASLMKQHQLFSEASRKYPRALSHLQRVGHFEFGLDLRPIHVGSQTVVDEIQALWSGGDEVRGWARYWASIYHFVADQLADDEVLREASVVVRYEELCDKPAVILAQVFEHCGLAGDDVVAEFVEKIAAPRYYRPEFTAAEEAAIDEETAAVVKRFYHEPALCLA